MTGVGAALYSANVQPAIGRRDRLWGSGRLGDHGRATGGGDDDHRCRSGPRKLEWAKEFGATHTVNPREVDAVAAIKEITGGYGVNASFEAVGRAETLETAIMCRDLAGPAW
jgi:S-(hydroxymethyl)mycothiol dehydrogenase